MGLAIRVFLNIRQIEDNDENEDRDDVFTVFNNPAFPGRSGKFETGLYEYDGSEHGLSMSYGGYSQWREQLALLAGWKPIVYRMHGRVEELAAASAWNATESPFWELICFSDAEGTIGPEHCAKLAKDFAQFQEQANTHFKANSFYLGTYNMMRHACEVAGAQNGVLSFS
jgi:hypothetical protein